MSDTIFKPFTIKNLVKTRNIKDIKLNFILQIHNRLNFFL